MICGRLCFLSPTLSSRHESSYAIVDSSLSTVMSDGPFFGNEGQAYHASTCAPADGCYLLVVNDSYGDGMSSGGYTVKMDGAVVLESTPGEFRDFFILHNFNCGVTDTSSVSRPSVGAASFSRHSGGKRKMIGGGKA